MKSYIKYSTTEKEKKVFTAVVFIIFLALVALAVLTICGVFDQPTWKPEAAIPIANANISWEQTFYPGPWGGM